MSSMFDCESESHEENPVKRLQMKASYLILIILLIILIVYIFKLKKPSPPNPWKPTQLSHYFPH